MSILHSKNIAQKEEIEGRITPKNTGVGRAGLSLAPKINIQSNQNLKSSQTINLSSEHLQPR